jgi:uncharacterized repeat protein (TIGR03803 family)
MLLASIVSNGQDVLYGMTQYGGRHNKGVPYQINTDGTGFLPYTDFDGDNGEHPGNGAKFSQLSDKRFVGTGFTIRGLVGLTELGYKQLGYGNSIKIRPWEGLGALYRFNFFPNHTGTNPAGGLLTTPEGLLYGMTSQNGEYGGGTLFSAEDIGNGTTLLGSFEGITTGRSPKGTPIKGSDGKLYGTAEFGGINDLGVIFSYDITGLQRKLTKLLDFDGAVKGSYPTGNLVLASDGRLYGMTSAGGANGSGVIFSISQDGTGYTKLLDFNGQDTGANPKGSLTEFTDGKLYGLTSSGGTYGYGTIISVSLTGTFTKVHDFNGTNGKSPVGDLLVDISGKVMYGVAYKGGVNDQGVLFRLQNGNQFTKLYDYSVATGSNPVGTLSMMREEVDIKVQPIPDKTTLSTPFTLVVENAVDMPVYFASKDTSVVAVENNKLVIKGAGSSQITAFQLGNHAYLGTSASTDVTVKKATQTITFAPLISKTFGDGPFTLTATSTSGLPITFSSSDQTVATIDGDQVTIRGGGRVNIMASQPGNSNYEAAKLVTQDIFVERAVQTISFQLSSPRVCCDIFNLSATSSAKLEVLFKSSNRMKIDIYGNSAQPRDAGTLEIIAYHPGNRSYRPAEVSIPVEILKGYQRIIFYTNNNTLHKVGDDPEYISAGSDRGLPVTYTSNPPGIAVAEKGLLYFLAEGTTTITATQPGTSSYHPAAPVSRTITVNPPSTPGVGNTITWIELINKTIIDPPFNLNATATSGLPVLYTSSNSSVAEINGNLVTIKGIGSTTITATQPGKTGVAAAEPLVKTLQVTKKDQQLYLQDMSSVTFGTAPIQLPATSYDGLPLTYSVSDGNVAVVENYDLHLRGAGYVTITASQPGNEKYLAAQPISTRLQIFPNHYDLFFKDLSTKTYGDPPFNLDASTYSGLPVTFSTSNPEIASVIGSKVTIMGTGSVSLTALVGKPGYYTAESTKIIVINKAKQSISFSPLETKKFGSAPFAISPASTSNLPVMLTTTTPNVVRMAGNLITIIGNGTAEIIASQAGNDNYLPAENVHQKFQVTDAGNTFDIVGATLKGGPNHSGVLFSMDAEGQGYEIIKQFSAITSPFPQGGFIKGADGKMYGNFTYGGTGNAGRVIRLEADGSGLTTLHDFKVSDGHYPIGNLIQGTNGDLYGTTERGGSFDGGTIFKIKPDGTGFTVLQYLSSLTGKFPKGGLTQGIDGKLYGNTTAGGFFDSGTIFTINTDGSGFAMIFHFATVKSGHSPLGELAWGPDGFLYGTTTQGGSASNNGTLFKIRPTGSDFTTLVEFNRTVTGSAPSALLFASDGKIYGMTGGGGSNQSGAIFSLNSDGTNFIQIFSFDAVNSGSFPKGKLMEGTDGALYGMTNAGGSNGFGTIFKINKNGTGFHKMSDLSDVAKYPVYGPLLESTSGNFFGMTSRGGLSNGGGVFKITSGDVLTGLYDFPQEESSPRNVIVDPTGEYYYGVAEKGGQQGEESIFRVNVSGAGYERIYNGPKGDNITAIFYASTDHLWVSGIHDNENFLFRIRPDGSELEQIAAYNAGLAQQRKPVVTMVETPEGDIFAGTDGNWSTPIFFKIRNDGTGFSKLFELHDSDRITGNLLHASDGNFYMAYAHEGIYKFTASGTLTKIFSHPADAWGPTVNKIIEMNGGRLGIVTRVNGSGSYGTIFSIEKDGTGYTKIYEPKLTDGVSPVDMLQSMDGWLYVASEYGGTHQKGVVYKVRPDGSSFTKIREFNSEDGETPNGIFFKKMAQSFTFEPIPEKKTSDPVFLPTAVSSSGARIHFRSSNQDVAIVENDRIKPVGKGTTIITATLPANANYYYGGEVERSLVVVMGGQTITFDALPKLKVQDATFQLTAISTAGLPVSYQSSNPAVASVSGSTITIHTVGTTTITASQAGNDNFFPATNVSQMLVVHDGIQSIAFTNPGTRILGTAPFELAATASSGLPVQFTTTSDKISLNGGQVTMLNAGRVTVVAHQPGDDNVEPAPSVEVSFCISPPKPFITETGTAPDLKFHSSNEFENQWYLNNSILTADTSKTIVVSVEGTYTVAAIEDGCVSEISEPKMFVTTDIEEASSIQINIYPNPVVDDLKVEIVGNIYNGAVLELLDAMGRSLEVKEMSTSGIAVFDLQTKGMFLIRVIVNGTVVVGKVLKQ